MRTNWTSYPVSFDGGLVTNLGLLEQGSLRPGSARKLLNFEASIGGGYRKVLGYRKYFDVPVPGVLSDKITGCFIADPFSVLAFRGKVWYKYTVGDSDWTTLLTVPTASPYKSRSASYDFGVGKKIVIVDSVNLPCYYDVTTGVMTQPSGTSIDEDILATEHVAVFADRIFYSKGSVVTYSNLLTDTSFDPALGAGSFAVKSQITGLVVFRNQLIIFGEDRIDYLTGTSEANFTVESITRKTGCPWPDSIQEVGGDILYKGPDGVRYLSATEKIDDFALSRASENIQDQVMESYVGKDEVYSLVVRAKNQYRMFYYNPFSGQDISKGFLCTRLMDQSSGSGSTSWSTLQGFRVYCGDSRQIDTEEIILFTDGINYIYQMEWGYSFDGSPIPFEFATPYFTLDDPRVRKTFYKHHVYMIPEGSFNIQTNLVLDFGDDTIVQPDSGYLFSDITEDSLYGTAVYGQSVYRGSFKTEQFENLVGSGFSGSIEYRGNDVFPSFTLSSLVLEYRNNDRK